MSKRGRWLDRSFEFDFAVELHAELLERLRGTPARLEGRLRGLGREVLSRRSEEGKWSIQEHAGHLMDLESLFAGRLDDFDAGAPELRPADVTNQKTEDADHNSSDLESILAGFRRERMALVGRLDALEFDDFARTALHPRLNQPMRLCDMMCFQAEHDDHHLATITELIKRSDE